MSIDVFAQAIEAHRQGDLDKALELYRRVLKKRPDDWAALHNTAVIHLSRGEVGRAIDLLREALRLNPDDPDALNNLATALKRVQDPEGAVQALEKALSLRPDFVEARFNLGNLYRDTGEYAKAADAFHRVLSLNPGDHDALNSLGALLSSMGRHEEAREACLKSLKVQPHQASVHYNLGTISLREGKREEAAQFFRTALRINPGFPEAHLNLGSVLAVEGRMEEAVESFRKAVSANPGSPDAYYNLGLALDRMGDLDGEISTQEAALLHCPDAPHSWVGAVRALSKIADWRRVDPLLEKIARHRFTESEASLLSSALFMLHSFPISDPELFQRHLLWGDHLLKATARLFQGLSFDFGEHQREIKRLRVGYVSPDFCRHSVGWFFKEIALHHDPDRFEIHCYATEKRDDDLTRDIQKSVRSFHGAYGWDTVRFAQRIHQDGIHILVDLAGHTQGNRLDVFALRPAPIQVSMIGYPNGTGLRTMDYRITDRFAETATSASCCLERHVYLPTGFLPLYEVRSAGRPCRREELGLPEKGILLVSFNRAGKLRPEVLRLWDRLLARCPEAALVLGCGYVQRSDLRRNILSHFCTGESRSRVFFISRAQNEELHRDRYSVANLALDPFPYAGTTTSYEALAMGVPVVTLVGERHAQRTTFSFLRRLGIQESAASSEEEYVEKAATLVNNAETLARIKEKLTHAIRRQGEAHAARYVMDLEKGYHIMWERYRQGLPAEEISL